jgi:hypothetical protein
MSEIDNRCPDYDCRGLLRRQLLNSQPKPETEQNQAQKMAKC